MLEWPAKGYYSEASHFPSQAQSSNDDASDPEEEIGYYFVSFAGPFRLELFQVLLEPILGGDDGFVVEVVPRDVSLSAFILDLPPDFLIPETDDDAEEAADR